MTAYGLGDYRMVDLIGAAGIPACRAYPEPILALVFLGV